jgi:hypothetical protein
MDLISNVVRVAKVTINEINKPESFVKGDAFENYVRAHLFVKDRYDLLQKTHDYANNKDDYIENTKEPDFKFRSKTTREEFYVEAKYRSGFHDNAIEWCKPFQLKRYKGIDDKTPVYLVLGTGNEPNSPRQVFFIPIKDIKHTSLISTFLNDYEVSINSPIDYRLLNRNDKNDRTFIQATKIERITKIQSIQPNTSGVCIRCGHQLELDPLTPYCGNCYKSWKIFSNKEYEEKYCHICGKPMKSTLNKPTCYTCYKANKDKLEFPSSKE